MPSLKVSVAAMTFLPSTFTLTVDASPSVLDSFAVAVISISSVGASAKELFEVALASSLPFESMYTIS